MAIALEYSLTDWVLYTLSNFSTTGAALTRGGGDCSGDTGCCFRNGFEGDPFSEERHVFLAGGDDVIDVSFSSVPLLLYMSQMELELK